MADISINSAAVALVTNPILGLPTRVISGLAGVAISAGQAVYQDVHGLFQLTLSTDSLRSQLVGIATSSAVGAYQQISVAVYGDLTIGATVVIGTPVTLGTAPGGISATAGDISAGWYPGLVGICVTHTTVRIAVATNNGQVNP